MSNDPLETLEHRELRNVYASVQDLQYRLRAAGALLGVSDNTLRTYADNAGIVIKRASDKNPGAPAVRVFDPDTLFQIAQWRRAQGYVKGPSPGSSPIVITVDVIKGGTGKSTTAAEMSIHLQMMGLKVLLVDLDTQANATQLFGYEADLTIDEAEAYGLTKEAIVTSTLADIMKPFLERIRVQTKQRTSVTTALDVIKRPFGPSGPALIPSDPYLGELEHALIHSTGQRELYLRQMLNAAYEGEIPGLPLSEFDVVIFDCPPAISFLATNALAAADFVVAPVRMDAFSVKGLSKLVGEIQSLAHAYKVRAELVILPTHYAPKLSRIGRMQNQLQMYRDFLSPVVISASEEFPKSLVNYLPLSLQKPTSNSAQEYQLLAEHMHAKILRRSAEKVATK